LSNPLAVVFVILWRISVLKKGIRGSGLFKLIGYLYAVKSEDNPMEMRALQ
jgi:hypothetical protein